MTDKVQSFQAALNIFSAKHGFVVSRWTGLSRRCQVFQVSTSPKLLLYVLDSSRPDGWWGITANVFSRLASSKESWRLALLIGDREDCIVLTDTQVKTMVSGLSTNANQYILHGKDVALAMQFKKFENLFDQVLT